MAFIPTNMLDQAIMFELEYVVESTMPVMADDLIHLIRCIGNTYYMHLDTVLNSRCRYFIGLPTKQRLKSLLKLLETFDSMYSFQVETEASLRPSTIPPSAFVNGRQEWPNFEW